MHHTTSRTAPHFILLTYHITPHPCHTPCSGHTIYWSQSFIVHRTTTSSHHITQLIAPHFTCFVSCIIPPHLITPNSTSHYHVSHNIPHHTVHHHILHPTTCYISHNATSTTTHRAVSQPTLCLIPHHTTFHIACHGTCTNPYYTTTFHNPGLQPYK